MKQNTELEEKQPIDNNNNNLAAQYELYEDGEDSSMKSSNYSDFL